MSRTTSLHIKTQNSSDNLPSYPLTTSWAQWDKQNPI